MTKLTVSPKGLFIGVFTDDYKTAREQMPDNRHVNTLVPAPTATLNINSLTVDKEGVRDLENTEKTANNLVQIRVLRALYVQSRSSHSGEDGHFF